jgi:hypothetical protein
VLKGKGSIFVNADNLGSDRALQVAEDGAEIVCAIDGSDVGHKNAPDILAGCRLCERDSNSERQDKNCVKRSARHKSSFSEMIVSE